LVCAANLRLIPSTRLMKSIDPPKRAKRVVKRKAPLFDEKRKFFDQTETIPKRECS